MKKITLMTPALIREMTDGITEIVSRHDKSAYTRGYVRQLQRVLLETMKSRKVQERPDVKWQMVRALETLLFVEEELEKRE